MRGRIGRWIETDEAGRKRILGGLKAYLRDTDHISTNNIATGMVRGGRKIRFRPSKVRFPPLARNVFL
jgi:hypothetical protein